MLWVSTLDVIRLEVDVTVVLDYQGEAEDRLFLRTKRDHQLNKLESLIRREFKLAELQIKPEVTRNRPDKISDTELFIVFFEGVIIEPTKVIIVVPPNVPVGVLLVPLLTVDGAWMVDVGVLGEFSVTGGAFVALAGA